MQICIIDFRLTYPSGTATGVMIRGFHTPLGEEIAKRAPGQHASDPWQLQHACMDPSWAGVTRGGSARVWPCRAALLVYCLLTARAGCRRQVKSLGKWGVASILWSMFKWCVHPLTGWLAVPVSPLKNAG